MHTPTTVLALASLVAAPLQAQVRIETLAPGIHAAIRTEGGGNIVNGNSLIVEQGAGVVVFDATSNAESARGLIAEIRRRTDKPVTHLVISHWHGDHSYGAQAFVDAWPGVEVVAHPATAEDLQGQGAENRKSYHASLPGTIEYLQGHLDHGTGLDDSTMTPSERRLLEGDLVAARQYLAQVPTLRVIAPTRLVAESLVIGSGDHRVIVRHLGRGNTRGDLILEVPAARIIATGDLVVWPTPYAFDSYLDSWTAALDTIVARHPVAIVPGHGPVLHDTSYPDRLRQTFRGLMTQADSLRRAGVASDSIAARIDVERYRQAFTGDDRARRQLWRFHFAGAAGRLAVEALGRRSGG